MVALSKVVMADLSRQRRFETDLNGDLTPNHTVGQAVEHYRNRMRIPENGLRWEAFSRGVRLDSKQSLKDLSETDDEWVVIPEVSAGCVSCGVGFGSTGSMAGFRYRKYDINPSNNV